ncbi:MAG: T9SS type A sorting domain-containing protein [Saprospiraceae bacterium]
MKKILLILCFCAPLVLGAQTIDWATDIAPILYEHCVSCHRDDGIGHFSLIGYGNAYSNRYGIRYMTEERQMPPWKADPEYRHYVGENVLTDAEILAISEWVEQGAPAGDMSQAPEDPVFLQGSEIGQADNVLLTPYYTLTSTEDEYRCFVMPSGLLEDAYLRGIEVIPGNHEAVHHVLIFEDTTGISSDLDAQTPEPGYVSFGGIGVQGARLVGAWVPGSRPQLLPESMGIKLHAGSSLVLQTHFPGEAVGLSEATTVNLFYTDGTNGIREVRMAPVLNHTPISLQDYPLYIPADSIKTYHAKFTIPIKASVLGVAPHMHLIGRSITSFAVTPAGDTVPLIRIPEWDFHWQGRYMFQYIQTLPAGTTLHAFAEYDNTSGNPNNPSFPPVDVSEGEATTDEMMLVYFTFMGYETGDENILLDSTLLSSAVLRPDNPVVEHIQLAPNPATSNTTLQFSVLETDQYQIDLVDASGSIVQTSSGSRTLPPGTQQKLLNVGHLPEGIYFVRILHRNRVVGIKRLVVQRSK